MKKFVSAALTLSLVLSLGATAMAAEKKDNKAETKVTSQSQKAPTGSHTEGTAEALAEAEAVALADAGFESTQVKGLHAYGVYEGRAVRTIVSYVVEFAVYDREASTTTVYTYSIGLDGEIISSNSVVRAAH